MRSRLRPFLRLSLQARLTLSFVGVTALTLALVSAVVINRLDDFTRDQVSGDLRARALTVRDFAVALVTPAADDAPVIETDGSLNPAVRAALGRDVMALFARIAQADVTITLGTAQSGPTAGTTVIAAPNGSFSGKLVTTPSGTQTRDGDARYDDAWPVGTSHPYGIAVSLSGAYTFRATTLAQATTLLVVLTIAAVGLAALVAIVLARRFTTPIRRLTDAARGLAEGDLTRRVELEPASAGSAELAALARQFNTMAARLEESVAIIRRDRDRSRDFLADVSHELRTPIAALRTFVELLQESAGDDPEARREFLDASAGQLERLDWLAQNLLELSRLESGLVLLDLRPEDLRAAVESAVEQADPTAKKRGVELHLELPGSPLRIRHDPQRIGQVVANLVGNAIKFTARGGHVRVSLAPDGDGATIDVADTGVGIDAAELPRIFERFYRGSQASEARGSGSGLGLAIVKSIVDMHGGRISVDSRVGGGTTFRVWLPPDPRQLEGGAAIAPPVSVANPSQPEAVPGPISPLAAGAGVDVANSSPGAGS
ncbi:MAG TPA: ATP-binding protein [Candidatus Limnocylindrales bacterium]|nr:ATP-binding protein [Candidatus Limnocylindrales bacterium]